jgi:phosphoribulokinase
MDNLNDLLAAQNKRILTLQLLVEALVDELIETKKIKEKK